MSQAALESSARTWEAILAELHPGHRFVVEFRPAASADGDLSAPSADQPITAPETRSANGRP